MTKDQKLERWAKKEIRSNLHNMIINDDQGGYIAFGKYYIAPNRTSYEVRRYSDIAGKFGSKRSAISWCVADNLEQLNLAREILVLDSKKQLVGADLNVRQALAHRSRNADFQETVTNKLQRKLDTYQGISAELEKCINLAKYLQLRGFSNETARTSRA